MSGKKKPFQNIVGKRENAVDQHFLLFPQCFLFLSKTNIIYVTFILSPDFQFVQIFVVLEWVKKTMWENNKMLEISIFSSSHSIFYPSQTKFQLLIFIYFVVSKAVNLELYTILLIGEELSCHVLYGLLRFYIYNL